MGSHADWKYCAAVKEEDDQELQHCEQQDDDDNPLAVAVKQELGDELSSEQRCPLSICSCSAVTNGSKDFCSTSAVCPDTWLSAR